MGTNLVVGKGRAEMKTGQRRERYATSVYEVAAALCAKYEDFAHNNRKNPLDELLFIICSTKTTGVSFENTYRRFRRSSPRFEDISDASQKELAESLSSGGLQNVKAMAVKQLVSILEERFGRPTLAPLKHMGDQECERFLTSLPGVGKKVARCVMMYSLDRQVFPVDTHCWRISHRIGWVRPTTGKGSCTAKDMDRLQEKIPPELRFSLHVNMVSLGRELCTFHDPKCIACPIEGNCRKMGLHRSE